MHEGQSLWGKTQYNWTIFSLSCCPSPKKLYCQLYGCTSRDSLRGIPPIPCYESPTDIDTYIHASHRSGRGSSYMLIGCINQCDGYLILSISTASSFLTLSDSDKHIFRVFNNQNQITIGSSHFKTLKEPPGFMKDPVIFRLLFGFFRIWAFEFFWEPLLWTFKNQTDSWQGLGAIRTKTHRTLVFIHLFKPLAMLGHGINLHANWVS